MSQKTVLDNGLRIVTASMPHTRAVSISIFIGVGSRYETEAEAGITHFIEHLCFKGTPKRPTAREISEAIEGVGGIINAATDKELTVYWCKIAHPHFILATDVLTDMLLHSKFDPIEVERERQVIIEEIHMSKDSPSQQVDMLIDELLWTNHPLGRDIAGSKESVSSTTREAMLEYQVNQYLPHNTVVAIAGGVQQEDMIKAIDHTLGKWVSQQPRPEYSAFKEPQNPRLKVIKRDIEQVHLCLALPGLPLRHPKRFSLDLLNVILGEGMSSRLFIEVRDKLGLAYSIRSFVDHFHDSGSVVIYAAVEPKNLETVIKVILEQLAQLKEVVPESELARARELSKGRHATRRWNGILKPLLERYKK